MLNDAEKFAEEDKLAKEKIDAKNSMDSYIHNMKNQLEDPEKLANKLDEEDKETINEAIKDARTWMD